MTLDELRGHVADVLAIPLDDTQTLRELQSRVNGADPNQLLVAALSVAREQRAFDDTEQRLCQLEELQELRKEIQHLARKCETKSKRR